jgi:cobalt/nickel transport protein
MKRWRFYVGLVVVGMGIALAVAFLSPLASSSPDGLERVSEDKEFSQEAKDAPYEVIPDYVFPGVDNENVATVLAGIVGVVIVAVLTFGIAFVLRRTGREAHARPSSRQGGGT